MDDGTKGNLIAFFFFVAFVLIIGAGLVSASGCKGGPNYQPPGKELWRTL